MQINDELNNAKKHRSVKESPHTRALDKDNKHRDSTEAVVESVNNNSHGVARHKIKGDSNNTIRHSSSNLISRRTFAQSVVDATTTNIGTAESSTKAITLSNQQNVKTIQPGQSTRNELAGGVIKGPNDNQLLHKIQQVVDKNNNSRYGGSAAVMKQ